MPKQDNNKEENTTEKRTVQGIAEVHGEFMGFARTALELLLKSARSKDPATKLIALLLCFFLLTLVAIIALFTINALAAIATSWSGQEPVPLPVTKYIWFLSISSAVAILTFIALVWNQESLLETQAMRRRFDNVNSQRGLQS